MSIRHHQQKKRDKKYIPASVKAKNEPRPAQHISMSCAGVRGVRECHTTGYSDIRAYKSIERLNAALTEINWRLQSIKTTDGVTIFVPICEVCGPILAEHIERLKAESVAKVDGVRRVIRKKKVITETVENGDKSTHTTIDTTVTDEDE